LVLVTSYRLQQLKYFAQCPYAEINALTQERNVMGLRVAGPIALKEDVVMEL
jgi:hypothetical protein